MTPESVLLALIAALLGTGLLVFWRLTNSTGKLEWFAKTTEPEHSRIRVERDEARREAERLRAELDRAPTIPPSGNE